MGFWNGSIPNDRNTCTRAVAAHCKVSWSLRKWVFLNTCTCHQSRRLLQTCRMNCSCVDTTCARSIVIVMPSPRGSDSSVVFRWSRKANVSFTRVFAIFLELTRPQKLDENANWMSWACHTCLVFGSENTSFYYTKKARALSKQKPNRFGILFLNKPIC